jgi:SAM-dependent methyltransferase
MTDQFSSEVKPPLVNWDEIERIAHRGMPGPPQGKGGKEGKHGKGSGHGGPGRGIGGWDSTADAYNLMVQMEKEFTPIQLDCFDTAPTDTVLDVCCGTGRVAVPMAQRAKSVTGIDASPRMLEYLDSYAKAEGVTNIQTILMDWDDKEAAAKLEKHDIVIASRNQALGDIDLLTSLARKYVVFIIWANGQPCIPMIIGDLFRGTKDETEGHAHGHGHGHGRPSFPTPDRRLGNNLLYNKVYDRGYDPNVRIVDDGYKRIFASREEAYAELQKLGKEPVDKIDVFRENADRYLSDNADGTVTYFATTKSMILWWRPEK